MNRIADSLVTTRPVSTDWGLLVLRIGVGLSTFLFHGWGKITGGPERWERIGGAMSNFGIGFAPTFWGFLAAAAESACAALLVLGLLTRPASLLLAFTMLVAAASHLAREPGTDGAGWSGASHALEIFAAALCLFLAGPGRITLARLFQRGQDHSASTR